MSILNIKSTELSNPIQALFILLASAFGLGLSPIAPGTCGALLGVIGHILIAKTLQPDNQLIALIMLFLVVCIFHFVLTPWAVNYWHSKDPKHFVLDGVGGIC